MRNTILRNLEAIEVHIRRAKPPEVCRIEVVNLRLIKLCKEGCGLTHRVRNCGKTAAHLKLGRSSREWIYQESTRHEMRSCGLKRTDLQGRNEEGDKGKGNSPGPAIMGAVGRTETDI